MIAASGAQQDDNVVQPPPHKRVHLDPFAQLENALGKKQEIESQEQSQVKSLEGIKIKCIRQENNRVCETYLPEGYERNYFSGQPLGGKYSCNLSPLATTALRLIESAQSVLVNVFNEDEQLSISRSAIALALDKQQAIMYVCWTQNECYQMYRQFIGQFGQIDLVIEQAKLRKEAKCTITTIAILRKMLFPEKQKFANLKWIILDNLLSAKRDMGSSWEQLIIILPKHIRLIFFSDRQVDGSQFAAWMAKLKGFPFNYLSAKQKDRRLQFYACPANGEGLYLVQGTDNLFLEQNAAKVAKHLQSLKASSLDKKKMDVIRERDLQKLIKSLVEHENDPIIVVSATKREVQANARLICTKYNLTSKLERERIEMVYTRSMQMLNMKDSQLASIQTVKEILKKGIGIYHQGLLPLIKEVVELLFMDGLIKILFTDAHLQRVNKHIARTIVFTNISEGNDQDHVRLQIGKFSHWVGGNKGNQKGTVVLILNDKIQSTALRVFISNQTERVQSDISLSFNSVLSHFNSRQINTEFILSRSLLQYQQDQALPALTQMYEQKQKENNSIMFQDDTLVSQLYLLKQQLKELKSKYRKVTHVPEKIIPFLTVGRIVRLTDADTDWGYGITVNFHKKTIKRQQDKQQTIFLVDCLTYIKPRVKYAAPEPVGYQQQGELTILTFVLASIAQISTLNFSTLPNLSTETSRNMIVKTMQNLTTRQIPIINIVSNKPESARLKMEIRTIGQQIQQLKHIELIFAQYQHKLSMTADLKKLKKQIKQASSMVLKKQLKARMKVMKHFDLVDKGSITLKGKMAQGIANDQAILLTELLISGFFDGLSPSEIAAVLSSFVQDDRSTTERRKVTNPKLRQKLDEMIDRQKGMVKVYQQCKFQLAEDYSDGLKEKLVEATFDWANGADFNTICGKTDSFQGSIVLSMQKLSRLLCDLSFAADLQGNSALSFNLLEANSRINRGIMLTPSLYSL